jgi:hypothetical protein
MFTLSMVLLFDASKQTWMLPDLSGAATGTLEDMNVEDRIDLKAGGARTVDDRPGAAAT